MKPRTDIALDFIIWQCASSGYKSSQRKDGLVDTINCFTKLARYYAVTSMMTASQVVDVNLPKLVLISANYLNSIVTGYGTQLISTFRMVLCYNSSQEVW
jgi:hypothetical protein